MILFVDELNMLVCHATARYRAAKGNKVTQGDFLQKTSTSYKVCWLSTRSIRGGPRCWSFA
eukprot:4026479-Amphidinium_carterae.2